MIGAAAFGLAAFGLAVAVIAGTASAARRDRSTRFRRFLADWLSDDVRGQR